MNSNRSPHGDETEELIGNVTAVPLQTQAAETAYSTNGERLVRNVFVQGTAIQNRQQKTSHFLHTHN